MDSFDRRDEFSMWLLEKGFDADFVMDYAKKASSSGLIWGAPKPETFSPTYHVQHECYTHHVRYLEEAMRWYFDDTFLQ